MLLAAMFLIAGGAVACAVGLLQHQAATFEAAHYIGSRADQTNFTHTAVTSARIWIWTGIIALAAGITALVTALRRQRTRYARTDLS